MEAFGVLECVIAEERGCAKPCPDLLAYLEGLREKPEEVIAEALSELQGSC